MFGKVKNKKESSVNYSPFGIFGMLPLGDISEVL